MELTEDQKQRVTQWVQEGHELADIQRLLDKELGLSLTYMETRFLVDDLDLTLQDQEETTVDPMDLEAGAAAEEARPVGPDPADLAGGAEAGAGGNVSVSVDKVQRPGAVVSGNVTFSDGQSAQWQIDQTGRLGLIPAQEGYRPSEEDLAQFQEALQNELQKMGF